jgi:hypothetical protein
MTVQSNRLMILLSRPVPLLCRPLLLLSLLVPALSSLADSAGAYARQEQEPTQPPKIVRKSSDALTGSAITRVEPTYPPLAKAALSNQYLGLVSTASMRSACRRPEAARPLSDLAKIAQLRSSSAKYSSMKQCWAAAR